MKMKVEGWFKELSIFWEKKALQNGYKVENYQGKATLARTYFHIL
jgi:hypothetical protein